MAEIKVSQLPEATQINDEDLLMIVQGNTNKKITKANAKFASGDEIFVGDTLPSGEDADSIKLWLTDDDALEGEGNYISNEYGTSQEIGYSQEYANEHYGGTILYNNPSGTSGNITLSDDISNYSFIDVTTINKDTPTETYGTYRFDTSLSSFRMMGTSIGTNSYYILEKKYTKGTNILTASSGRIYNSSSGASSNYEPISIIKIVGYK